MIDAAREIKPDDGVLWAMLLSLLLILKERQGIRCQLGANVGELWTEGSGKILARDDRRNGRCYPSTVRLQGICDIAARSPHDALDLVFTVGAQRSMARIVAGSGSAVYSKEELMHRMRSHSMA